MNTPIYDFVRRYAASHTARLHMPGHKGVPFLGCEPLDITEITGTGTLIRESEENASALFGSARTLYSTGGSSQCVRAMAYLAVTAAETSGTGGEGQRRPVTAAGRPVIVGERPVTAAGRPVVVAARNAHKSLLYAAALCDAELVWLWPDAPAGNVRDAAAGLCACPVTSGLCACPVTAGQVCRTLEALSRAGRRAAAVYVTSPDYLGGVQDIAALARAAHGYGVPLLVDNAHGAYLKFLPGKQNAYAHPLDLGADLCCDSAHKTLPVLTGGAYLHIGKNAPASFRENAGAAMELFGSTSPSWLILASLDLCSKYLSGAYPDRLAETVQRLEALRARLRERGWTVRDSDPLRLTLQGDGYAMRDRLRRGGVEWEYADREYLVLMATPENPASDLDRVADALGRCGVSSAVPFPVPPPETVRGETVLTPREAVFSPQETVPIEDAVGRVCGAPAVSCPPAVPIAVSGERIGPEAVEAFRYYGIETVEVVKALA